jgi:hypothetical protein
VGSDALEEIAKLIAAVGRCYQGARRYRAIAAASENRTLERALEIGATVRRGARGGGLDAVAATAAASALRALLAECEAAVAGVRASALYRRAARAWEEGRGSEVTALAPEIFADVEPYPGCPTLYHQVSVAGKRRGGEHFVAPETCAAAIAKLARDGIAAIATPTDLGADETIRAVFLSDDPETLDSPVALLIEPASLGIPVCRVGESGDVAIYIAKLRVAFQVRCAPVVSDEWWAVRPDAYTHYVDELRRALSARAIPLVDGG